MKKIILIAAVAIAAAACSKTFDTNPAASQKAIGFGSWNETLTKARATGADDTAFNNGDAFDVYGTKTLSGAKTVVFSGDDVTATVASGSVTWDYTTKRYWDPAATAYEFYAVLPANKLTAEANAGDYAKEGKFSGSFTFGDPKSDTKANDIMIANQTSVAPAKFGQPVNMVFNHAASCIDVYVKKDVALDGAVVKVTDLSILGIKNAGDFAVSNYTASKPTVVWTNQAGTGNYSVIESADVTVGGSTTYDASHNQTNTATGAAKIVDGYVFMPQGLVADTQKVKISYTIKVGTEEPNTYTDIEIDFNTFQESDTDDNHDSAHAITAWNTNTHYIYYITIGAKAIKFTAEVVEWEATTVSGYHYIVK